MNAPAEHPDTSIPWIDGCIVRNASVITESRFANDGDLIDRTALWQVWSLLMAKPFGAPMHIDHFADEVVGWLRNPYVCIKGKFWTVRGDCHLVGSKTNDILLLASEMLANPQFGGFGLSIDFASIGLRKNSGNEPSLLRVYGITAVDFVVPPAANFGLFGPSPQEGDSDSPSLSDACITAFEKLFADVVEVIT